MKIKLKEGVSASDIPRFSGVYKRMTSMLSSKNVVDFDEVLPKGWEGYVEEVNAPNNKKEKEIKKEKGDK